MGMQNNFRLPKTKNNILYALSGATLTLFAGLILFPTISDSTHAEGDAPDDGITITVDNEVTANLVLFDEGDYKIAKDTVSVSSSAAYGYELFLTTDSEAHQSIYLNDDPTSESRIAPVSGTIAEPAVLTNNTWGFAVAGQGNFDDSYDPTNPDPASRFAIIPTADNQQAVFENTAATAEDNIDFYYGVKVEPTLEVGRYTTGATYTAIAKEKPRTAKAILGNNGNLNFVYDNTDYTAGDTYTDNIGQTKIRKIFTVPTRVNCTALEPHTSWVNNSSIATVNFDNSFKDFWPTTTCAWFKELRYLTSISNAQNLNTSRVTDMSDMFLYAGYEAATFSLNLNGWNTSHVTNMSGMFQFAGFKATAFSLDANSWDTSSTTNMAYMFRNAGGNAATFSPNISDWNIGRVTNLGIMFEYAGYNATTFNLDLSSWDTSSATDVRQMFNGAGKNATTFNIGNIGGWKTGSITTMSIMFNSAGYNATTWNIGDLSGWNTGNVTDMYGMFNNAGYNATTWNIGNLGYIDDDHPGWNTSRVTDMGKMFNSAGYNATTWNIGDISGWNVAGVTRHTSFISLNANQSNASVVNNQPGGWTN